MNELAYYDGDLCPDRLRRQLELGYPLDWLYSYEQKIEVDIVTMLVLEVNVSDIIKRFITPHNTLAYDYHLYILNTYYQYEDRVKSCRYPLKNFKKIRFAYVLRTIAMLKLMGISENEITNDFLRVLSNYYKQVTTRTSDMLFLYYNQERLSELKNNVQSISTMRAKLNIPYSSWDEILKHYLDKTYGLRPHISVVGLNRIYTTLAAFILISQKRFLQYLKESNYLKENKQ